MENNAGTVTDRCVLDLYVISNNRKEIIGRPLMQVAVDAKTRLVHSYHLSFNSRDEKNEKNSIIDGCLTLDEINKVLMNVVSNYNQNIHSQEHHPAGFRSDNKIGEGEGTYDECH